MSHSEVALNVIESAYPQCYVTSGRQEGGSPCYVHNIPAKLYLITNQTVRTSTGHDC